MTLLTLDWFSRSMRFPALNFMGLQSKYYECEALDCLKRNTYVQMADSAEAMIEQKAQEACVSLYPSVDAKESGSPVVWMKGKRMRRIVEHTASVVPIYSPALSPEGMATLNVTIANVPKCEEFVAMEVVFAECTCMRLGVEWCKLSVAKTDVPPVSPATEVTLQNWVIHAEAKAWNFLNIDTETPPDDLMTSVDVKVITTTPALPTASYAGCSCEDAPVDPCTGECCALVAHDACVQITGDVGIIGTSTCGCCGQLVEYGYSLYSSGVWQQHWQEAIISLMNTMLPINYCACEAITNARWSVDRGEDDRAVRESLSSFWNPFGIAMPGAQRAWHMVEPAMSMTQVWN